MKVKRKNRMSAISQSRLDLRLEQAVYILAGRQCCGWRSGPLALGAKLGLQARVVANFLAAWASKLFDLIILSGSAVYPLKNRIGEAQSRER